jgi:Tfp pilus assembly protein PilP
MRAYLIAIALVLGGVTACGEDQPPPPPPRPPAGGGAAKPGGPKGKVKQLKPVTRVEDRVVCPAPSDAKKCDPKAPVCAQGQFCIPAGEKDHYCGPCPERDAIRHTFKPRDFQGTDIRDPFQSFVIVQPGLGGGPGDKPPQEVTPKCSRKDQFVATSYNYQSLKLIGIVSQGTQRKVLLSDGRLGHIVKKGDCVGKEKAVVKDIGAGYVTFAVEAQGKTDPAEYSMTLFPTNVQMQNPDAIDPGAAGAPQIAPPGGAVAPAPISPVTDVPPPPPAGTTTTIVREPPKTQTVQPPPQAPTQLKP